MIEPDESRIRAALATVNIIDKRHFQLSGPNPMGWLEATYIIERPDGKRVGVSAVDPESVGVPIIRSVLWARLVANILHECPVCGARGARANRAQRRKLKKLGKDNPTLDGHIVTEHEDDCPVGDDGLRDLVAAHYGLGRS